MTQIEWVKQRLNKDGEISRNLCLQNYISRLSSIIKKLEKKGWRFSTKWREKRTLWGWSAKDYIYILEEAGDE